MGRSHARRRALEEARLAAQRERERGERAQRRRTALLAGVLVLVVLVLGTAYLVVQDRRAAALDRRMEACARDTESDGTEGGGHVTAPTYDVDPPAGGDHLEQWARAGAYAGAQVPSDGLLVHSLEHGYVVVWYTADAELAPLLALQEAHDSDVILAERPGLDVPVAATAWGQRMLCSTTQVDALEAFVERFVGKGPEKVDRG